MATLMLENQADIRFIEAMLGHAELSTIQIYSQVSVRQLKAIHTATLAGKLIAARRKIAAGDPPSDPDVLIAAYDAEAAKTASLSAIRTLGQCRKTANPVRRHPRSARIAPR